MAQIRLATADDVKDVFKLLLEMHKELGSEHFGFCPEKTFTGLLRWIDKPDAAMFVAVTSGGIVGVFAGTKTQMWWSNDVWALEHFFFVTKDSRGSNAANSLVAAFVNWAELDAHHVQMGVGTGAGEKAERLYKKFGLHYVGGNFLKHFKV